MPRAPMRGLVYFACSFHLSVSALDHAGIFFDRRVCVGNGIIDPAIVEIDPRMIQTIFSATMDQGELLCAGFIEHDHSGKFVTAVAAVAYTLMTFHGSHAT